MKTTVGQLKRLIQEEREHAEAVNEIFGKKADFGSMMKDVLQDLYDTNKKIEQAHSLAPQGPAKAIVAGMHSDLFNKVAEFRKHIEELMKLSKGAHAEGLQRKLGSRR